MQFPKSFLPICTLVVAFTANAVGEMKEWRSPRYGFCISYNTDVWTAIAPDRINPGADPRLQLAFSAMTADRSVAMSVRVTPTTGTQLTQEALKVFADGFARSAERAGKKNTLEWTQTDFTTEAGCIFRVHYGDANPHNFMAGRLVVHNGGLYQIVAIGEGSSEELRNETERVLRTFTFSSAPK